MPNRPEPPSLDLQRILRTLNDHGVEYLLVGGGAALGYGATRPTGDADCLPRRTRDNLTRLATAMRALNARLRVEGLDDREASQLPVVIDADSLARQEVSTWTTDAGWLDILADIPDRHGRHHRYDELARRAGEVTVSGVLVRVAALDDVISSKEWANRPKDHDALPELRRLLAAAQRQQGLDQADPGTTPSPGTGVEL